MFACFPRQRIMSKSTSLEAISRVTEAIIGMPFEWCHVSGGNAHIEDASGYESIYKGTIGGTYQVDSFAIAKYPVTNSQYQRFVDARNGQSNIRWWKYSVEAMQWWKDRPRPMPTAFAGANVSRTRVSWFDCMAFCAWLSTELESRDEGDTGSKMDVQDISTWCIRLPTEQEWQRAAVADTGWLYPWGDELSETYANYGNLVGRPTAVGSYSSGHSPYGVMDMVGNLWEWCRTTWGKDSEDMNGYIYRVVKGGAWNVGTPEYLRATDRTGFPPRSRLNDAGFRCVYYGHQSPAKM